jgi:hypothetical protein
MALQYQALDRHGGVGAKPFLELNTTTLEFGALTSPYASRSVALRASHSKPIHGAGNHCPIL